jgi:hypothetical protein
MEPETKKSGKGSPIFWKTLFTRLFPAVRQGYEGERR